MQKSDSKRRGRREGFTLIEVALAAVLGSMMLASTAYATQAMSNAIGGVYDETILQSVGRDFQYNLDKTLNAANKDGVPDNIAISVNGMTMGNTQMKWTAGTGSGASPGGSLQYSVDQGNTWSSMADIGSRGDFAMTEFAYGKFAPADDTDIPTPDRTTFVLDDRIRNQLIRVTTKLQKNNMVPMYMQQVRAPRALTWSWVQTSVAGSSSVDTDKDGVTDDKDDFPLDSTRAYSSRYPTTAGNTASVAYEDLYPSLGDADFNDLVSSFYIKETYGPGVKDATDTTQRPGLMQIYMRWFAQARGAGYDHAQRISLASITKGGGSVTVTRYRPDGTQDSTETFSAASRAYVDIFPDSKTQLPPGSDGWSTNVTPGTTIVPSWSTVVQITLTDPTQNRFGTTLSAPYDPYLYVKDTSQEIHRPLCNSAGGTTGVIDSYKFANGTITKVVDSSGDPWSLLVPGNWAWPLEGQRIDIAYPQFNAWVAAGRPDTGAASSWFLAPVSNRYKTASLNSGSVAAPTPIAFPDVSDRDVNNNDRYVYVFGPGLFTNGQTAFLAPTTATTVAPSAAPTTAVSPSPVPSGAQAVYPIGISKDALTGKNPGDVLNLSAGATPGTFGWLTWTSDTSPPTLAGSLTVPGNEYNYVNPANPTDTALNLGDNINGWVGTEDASAVRTALNTLEGSDIVVPVWDSATPTAGTEAALYHTYGFAKIRLNSYLLTGDATMAATFKGYVSSAGLPSTAPTPTPAPTAVPTATPTPGPSPTATATPLSANNIMPIGFGANLIASLPAVPGPNVYISNSGNINCATSTNNYLWLTWAGRQSDTIWQTSMLYPGNASTYINPSNSSDHVLSVGDWVPAYTNVQYSNPNMNTMNALMNKTLVCPVFNQVANGEANISGFVKVILQGFNLNGTNSLQNVHYLGTCNAQGN